MSDSEIVIGAVDQLSGIIAGFAQGAADGAQAYVDHVNATGGLCGRALRLVISDDGFDASRHASETERLERSAYALVGGFSVVDDGAIPVLTRTNMPDLSVANNDVRAEIPSHYGWIANNYPSDYAKPEHRWLRDNGGADIAIVTVNVAASRANREIEKRSMRNAGLNIVREIEFASTQFSFTSTARSVAESGATSMYFLGDINASVQMAEELAQIQSKMKYPFYILAYGQKFLDLAGPAAEGTTSFIPFVPFEEAGTNAGLDLFLNSMQRTAPGADPVFDSASAFLQVRLFVETLRSLPGPITRPALLEALKTVHAWDGGGMVAPVDVGGKMSQECRVVVQVRDRKWTRIDPTNGFIC